MGCDIHLYVEKKANGVWEAVRGQNPDIERYRRYAVRQREQGDEKQALVYEKQANDIESGDKLSQAEDDWERDNYAPLVLADWAYDGRNYDLFSMLANVRNGYGFAGSYTGEGFKPLSEPKGLPEDISETLKKVSDDYGCDGHSHSWHTVKDLIEYDWEQTTQTLKPGLYPVHAPREILQESLEGTSYRECAGSFYTETIPKLRELAGEDLESVRLVFWFDN